MRLIKHAYFTNGILYDVKPRNHPDSLYEDRDIAYNADVITSDGVIYDLSALEEVKAIAIPDFPVTANCTAELSYILKIRCGLVKDTSLLPVFVDKVVSLMQASHMLWSARDYLQVIRNYYRCGLFVAGDVYEYQFRNAHPDLFMQSNIARINSEHEQTKRYFKKKYEKRELPKK